MAEDIVGTCSVTGRKTKKNKTGENAFKHLSSSFLQNLLLADL